MSRPDPSPLARYRIVAGEAHSWASLLVEDERGARYLYSVHAGSLAPITSHMADDLLRSRAYRPWRGDRSWRPLHQLPVGPAKRVIPGGSSQGHAPVPADARDSLLDQPDQ
ncbi:MAG: hypothetical protein KatS3mg059_1133 [Thermomicrobiales bacterium]|nr:MAG: hypothetical protein KatS3mg059_1133 [Thermomicrobiales bacterium]